MLKIRLKRAGRKRKPFYRLVLMENLTKRDGRAIADLDIMILYVKLLILINKCYTNTSITVLIRQILCVHLIYKMLDDKN